MSEALTITNSSGLGIASIVLSQTGGITDEYEYCYVGYDNWQDLAYDFGIGIEAGQGIRIRAKHPITERQYDYKYVKLKINFNEVTLSGNINSMITPYFEGLTDISEYTAALCQLFEDNETIIDASELEMPATTLSEGCYSSMFGGCVSLVTPPPELPATVLTDYCYAGMFADCMQLTTVPKLLATTLAEGCYQTMFNRTGITIPPKLPVTTMPPRCYTYMFGNCTNIKLSETQTDEYARPYRIPTSGEGTASSDSVYSMFFNTGGTFEDTPNINQTYYLQAPTYDVVVKYQNEDGETIHADDIFTVFEPDEFVPTPIGIAGHEYNSMEQIDDLEWVLTYNQIYYKEGVYHWTGTEWKLDADVATGEGFKTYYQEDEPTEGNEGDFWVYGGDA